MTTDYLTNTVYFAQDTAEEFPEEFSAIQSLIKAEGYRVKVLQETSDFYCRDYMPVQLSEKDFVQFEFKPQAYLKDDVYISNPTLITLLNQLPTPRHSKIALDGGNIIRWTDKAIVSDRVYKDNITIFGSKENILKELEKNLQCEVIIIPEYPNDPTGHADGLIRFISADKVFINDTYR
jgi:agmatine deiminase